MTFAEQFQNHRGGLVRLRSQLYWYGGRGYDSAPGRLCLLLDAAPVALAPESAMAVVAACEGCTLGPGDARYAAHILVDGQPLWVWVAEGDVELL